jgi:hypothetical protein
MLARTPCGALVAGTGSSKLAHRGKGGRSVINGR